MTNQTDRREPEGLRTWKDRKRLTVAEREPFKLPTGHLLRVWLDGTVVCIEFSEQRKERE